MMMRLDFLSLCLVVNFFLLVQWNSRDGRNEFSAFPLFQNWSYSIDQLAGGIKTRCVLALISSSVCLFKLAYPIFLFIESIRLVLFLRSRDMIMEQVKQTFRFSLSLLLLLPPDNFSASINFFDRKYFLSLPWSNEWESMLFFFKISSLWEVWSFCSFNFKFFANNLKLKNELSLFGE